MGVIHNLSVDIVSIAPIVECQCISALVALLRDPSMEICRAAAGAIQNLSRDIAVRTTMVDSGAVDYLSDLLFANDIDCQVKDCLKFVYGYFNIVLFHHRLQRLVQS